MSLSAWIIARRRRRNRDSEKGHQPAGGLEVSLTRQELGKFAVNCKADSPCPRDVTPPSGSPTRTPRMAFASGGSRPRGQRELVTLSAMPPRSQPASGLRRPATGLTTAPMVSSSKPVPQDLHAYIGRGHREVPGLGNDPRHWPGLRQEAPAHLRRQGIRRHRGAAGSPAGGGPAFPMR
jgi:hypothetical protein